MRFEEKPDYDYLKNLFKNLMTKLSFEYDNQFDWVPMEKLNEIKEKFKEKEELKKEENEKKEIEKKENEKKEKEKNENEKKEKVKIKKIKIFNI